MAFWYLLLLLIVCATLIILLGIVRKVMAVWFRGFQSVGGEEYSETSSDAIRRIAEFIHSQNLETSTFYDLGCSLGDVVFPLHDLCPSLKIIGVEQQRSKFYFSLFENFFQKRNSTKPIFLKQDFYTTDLSQADIVFVYIPRVHLEKLSHKLGKELRPGAYVITYRIDFSDWIPEHIMPTNFQKGASKNSIFIYKRGKTGFLYKK